MKLAEVLGAMGDVYEEGDCHCHHSWYDHIGWREGSTDKRVSCRIIGCGCECYTEAREYEVDCKPGAIFISPKSFDPSCTYGNRVSYTGKFDSIPAVFMSLVHKDAKHTLPTGQYYEIHGEPPTNYGQDKTISWIYDPRMCNFTWLKWTPDLKPPIPMVGSNSNNYYLIGGYYA